MDWLFERAAYRTPGLALRVQLLPEVAIEEVPSGGVELTHSRGTIRLDGLSAAVGATLRTLKSGWVEQTTVWSIAAACEAGNARDINLASLSEHAWVLNRVGSLFRIQLVKCGRPLATIEPLSSSSHLLFRPWPEGRVRLSRFAFLQRHDDGLALESAVAAHRVVLHDEDGAALIGNLARGTSLSALPIDASEAGDETALAVIELLDAAGMLEGREQVSAAAIGDDLLETGEFHDLLFHRRSRFGRHDAPFGAQFPYLDKRSSPPAFAPPLGGSLITLSSPSEQEVQAHDLTLTQALERRTSVREYDDRPMSLSQLAEFLFRCARLRARYGPAPEFGMPYEATDRPHPSGGAIHDLELYLTVTQVQDLPAGVYHYAADRHALETLVNTEEDIAPLLWAAMRSSSASRPPHVLIHIASRFARMAWKYRSISYATTLKNVGVLYQTMYLVGTAMGLAVCALGSGDDVAAERALNLASRSEIAVGEFMLGIPPAGFEPRFGGSLGQAHATWQPGVEPNWGRASFPSRGASDTAPERR